MNVKFLVSRGLFVGILVATFLFAGLTSNVNAGSSPLAKSAALRVGNTVASIDAGALHACAVRQDGRMKCWGDNAQGQAFEIGGNFVL